MAGSIELKQAKGQVRKQVRVSAVAETLMMLEHIAAELMAEHMALEPAEELLEWQMGERRIDRKAHSSARITT